MLTLYWNGVFLIKIPFSANSAHYCTTCLNHCSLFLDLPSSGVHEASQFSLWALWPHISSHPTPASPHKVCRNIKKWEFQQNFNRPLQLSKINSSPWLFCRCSFNQGWWTINNIYNDSSHELKSKLIFSIKKDIPPHI